MFVLGYSLDNLSLMALTIAVGFVVDDAIVMLENIYRHIEDGMNPMEAALRGAGEIGFTIISISLSLIAVFIPLLLMGGHRRTAVPRIRHDGGHHRNRVRLGVADTHADDVLALPEASSWRPMGGSTASSSGFSRLAGRLSADFGSRAAVPVHHADGVHRRRSA